jgi:hypothetical protein
VVAAAVPLSAIKTKIRSLRMLLPLHPLGAANKKATEEIGGKNNL